MQIFPIKAFSDNYIWIIEQTSGTIIVDPGEADGVLEYLGNNNFEQISILLTHNHEDHIGGVKKIVEQYPEVVIYGPTETELLNTHTVTDGNVFDLNEQRFEVFKTAGHTNEHISYLMNDDLFCGDALFSGGCGRVFTGDYQAAFIGMEKFRRLPDNTNVYAGHEYTETNLRFAHSVEPNNQLIKEELDHTRKLIAEEEPTLPSTIGKEKEINLFMMAETLEDFIKLRNARDEF